jgi:hypothetical protein
VLVFFVNFVIFCSNIPLNPLGQAIACAAAALRFLTFNDTSRVMLRENLFFEGRFRPDY